MNIEGQNVISRNSRGILYRLKQQLNNLQISLIQHIRNIFQSQKQEYNRKEFFTIINTYDNNLILSELDQLFDQLDQNKNLKISYYRLKAVYEEINESDNLDGNKLIKTASKKTSEKIADIFALYSQIRKVLLQSQEIVEILHTFAIENGGCLTVGHLIDIFNSLGYNNEQYKKAFIQSIFDGNKKILVLDFLMKLDLNESDKKTLIQKSPKKKQQEIHQSQFIKNHKKECQVDKSFSLCMSLSKKSILNDGEGEGFIPLEKVPSSLIPYFNYGSQLETIFAHLARQYIETNSMFIDSENPMHSQAYEWVHLAETARDYELFQMAKSVLVRQNRKGLGQLLEPKDVIQGSLGDCYFLSAVAGVVEKYPQLIFRLFVLQKNLSHLFGVRLFIEGMWRTIILDVYFPINRNGEFCAAQPHHKEIWVMLLEKAWAKVYGSYDNIHLGYNEEGLNAISGAPSIQVSTRENQFIRRVEVQLRKGSIITCSTSSFVNQLGKNDQDNLGIIENHAYSLLDIYPNLRNRDGSNLVLLKIRNPWGRKQWQGRWSYLSELWTSQLRKRLDYQSNPKDGTFFMSQQDFSLYFGHINICKINLAYKNSWIQINAEKGLFKAIKIKVKQKGDYYFTLYQENPRRYSGKAYEKSKSWIFLCQEKNGKIQAIGSCCKDKSDNTLEVTLDVGQYIIVSRIEWQHWEVHTYCLSSYGPEKIKFTLQPDFHIHLISDFIQSKAKLGFGKKSFYDKANILKRVEFSLDQGYGFILINNQQNVIFDLTIRFDSHLGLAILPPYSIPVHLQIFPGEQVICKFLVDPAGYSYSLKESYNFINPYSI